VSSEASSGGVVAPSRSGLAAGLGGKLALSLAAIVLTLAVAEVGVRVFTRTSPALIVSDPVVGKRFRAGYSGRVFVPECACEVELRFNGEGLRGPDLPRAKPPGLVRVALVGDSMVAAVATAEERTLARQLEERLAAGRPGSRIEVMNAGVSSSSTGSELALYREVLAGYAPDVVVLLFYQGNDLADNSWALTRAPRLYFELDASGELRQRPFAFPPGAVSDWLDRHSGLYVWQKTALRLARDRVRAAREVVDPVELVWARPEPAEVAHAWAITQALVKALARETAARGSRLVLVAAPPATSVYDDLWQELEQRAARRGTPLDRDHADERLAAIARAAGVPFLSLTPAFRAATPHRTSTRPDEQLFHEGRFHWNDAGNALAARVIHAFLLEAGTIGA
jgi:hypothetical protein